MAVVDSYYTHPHVQAQLFPNYDEALRDGLTKLAGLAGLGLAAAEDIQQLQAEMDRHNREIEAKLARFRISIAVATLIGLGGALIGISLYLRRT